jgi:uncharacterized phosphosugar-binding protein
MSIEIPRYIHDLQEKISLLAGRNSQALDEAAQVCADALADKKIIHIYDTGHIISHEMIVRTGGLAAFSHLSFDGVLENRNLWRARENSAEKPSPENTLETERALIDWLFGQRTLQRGDVLILGSVSGLGIRLVELAIQARAHGLHVITVTGKEFSSQLVSKHPSGKHLYEVSDIVLDNQADYGDAFFAIPGCEKKICPSSGLAATILMWSLTVGIVENLAQRGIQASIYESVNLPDGPKRVEAVEARYEQEGI